jgi:hypothetical protein
VRVFFVRLTDQSGARNTASWGTVGFLVYLGVMSLVGGDPVAVVDGQGVEDGLPSVDLADRIGPACLSFLGHQVENLEGGPPSPLG